jgi:hypothetical protein
MMEGKLRSRLQLGKERYGQGVVTSDAYNWINEAEEELLDCIIYILANYVKHYQYKPFGEERDDNRNMMYLWRNKHFMEPCTTKTMLFSLESLVNMLNNFDI